MNLSAKSPTDIQGLEVFPSAFRICENEESASRSDCNSSLEATVSHTHTATHSPGTSATQC